MLPAKQYNALVDFLQYTFLGMILGWILPKWCVLVYGFAIIVYCLLSITILFLERKGNDV